MLTLEIKISRLTRKWLAAFTVLTALGISVFVGVIHARVDRSSDGRTLVAEPAPEASQAKNHGG